jgi:hypothetical protein
MGGIPWAVEGCCSGSSERVVATFALGEILAIALSGLRINHWRRKRGPGQDHLGKIGSGSIRTTPEETMTPIEEDAHDLRRLVDSLRTELTQERRKARSRDLARMAVSQLNVDTERWHGNGKRWIDAAILSLTNFMPMLALGT